MGELEICPDCNGAGGDNNTFTCSRCDGSGGVTTRPSTPVSDELVAAPASGECARLRAVVEAVDKKVDEAHEIGLREGRDEAMQEIDLATGGDGEYRYSTNHDPERHCPDGDAMKARILARFEAATTISTLQAEVERLRGELGDCAKALKPFDRIWGAIESAQELDRDATLTRWLHINGPGASGGSHLDQEEVQCGMRAYRRARQALEADHGQ
jgi:hypothetical protein